MNSALVKYLANSISVLADAFNLASFATAAFKLSMTSD